MAGPALLHAYSYAHASTLARSRARGSARLTLATSSTGDLPHPYFLEGALVAPRRAADAMLAVARVARTRFFAPPAMVAKRIAAADPVVTCTAERVRFEAFSACAGVYTRFDLDASGLRASHVTPGTTNVDFNAEMRALLARIGATEEVELSVGKELVRVASAGREVIERKVPLPVRWLRSFGEVQAILSRMKPALRVSSVEARRFVRALPRQPSRGVSWVVGSGRGLRLSQVGAREGVMIGGLGRLAVLDEALGGASELLGYGEPGGSSAWEVVYPEGRFTLALSPEAWRGFSGEGGLLADLASDGRASPAKSVLATVRAKLRWQASLDPRALAREAGCSEGQTRKALATLASRGLVGFELGNSSYFHRELPLPIDALDGMHPRLEDAKKLLEAGAVSGLTTRGATSRACVAGAYEVSLAADGFKCSCPWYGKHGVARGPCKHVLAVQLATARDDGEDG
jgi:hypothetical protein